MSGSPLRGRLSQSFLQNAVEARVRRVTVAGNRTWLDCVDPKTGQEWTQVPLLTQGSSAGSSITVPIGRGDPMAADSAAPRACLMFRDEHRAPVCVGFFQHAGQPPVAATGTEVSQDEDHPADIAASDWAVRHGGSTLALLASGDFLLEVGGATARIQLPEGGLLRISAGGNASERLVLAGPLLAYLAQLEAKVDELEARLESASAPPAGGALVLTPPIATVTTPKAQTSQIRSSMIAVPSAAE